MMRKRNQGILVFAGVAMALTACSHAIKRADVTGEGQKASSLRQEPPARNLASESEDAVELMKKWVVTPHETHGFVTSLDQIAKLNLFSADADPRPWRGSFWPDKLGGVAAHYRQIDTLVALQLKVEANYRKWKRKNERTVKNFDNLSEQDIALLSPAEKYDLLMGDRDFTFSNRIWQGILLQARIYGKLAAWSGICNGWTAASIELQRPRSTVRAMSPHGKVINFYPDDMKALASVLWAHSFVGTESRFDDGTPGMVMYGLRCDVGKPKRQNGIVADLADEQKRVSADECRDLNPAMWHLSMVNRVGTQKKAFVMDVDYNDDVNNHAVYGYTYKYFNVQNGRSTSEYREALVPVGYSGDPFATMRDSRARYLLGVEMKVRYIDYTKSHNLGETYDDESLDKTAIVTIKYDLELDENHKPINGNWRVNRKQKKRFLLGYQKPQYPDFMWYQRMWTWSSGDYFNDPDLISHDWSQPIPEILRKRSKEAAATEWKYTLRERARMTSGPLADAARKASDDYDNACNRLCAKAYPRDSSGNFLPSTAPEYNSPAAIAARKEMEPFDTAFSRYSSELDKLGIPRSHPYVQPLARVVYGLLNAAKDPSPNPPPRPEPHLQDADR